MDRTTVLFDRIECPSARADIAIRHRPQDGGFRVLVDEHPVPAPAALGGISRGSTMSQSLGPTLRMRRCLAGCVALAALLATPAGLLSAAAKDERQQRVEEYRLKAGFLYNFAKFVEWPSDAFTRPDAPFSICVAGEDPFGELLDDTVRQRMVAGRTFTVVRLRKHDDPLGCHLLFIADSDQRQASELRELVRSGTVLTVGESKGFAERGGVFGFVMEEDQVRLEINVREAERARLRISSRLLSLARLVPKAAQPAGR